MDYHSFSVTMFLDRLSVRLVSLDVPVHGTLPFVNLYKTPVFLLVSSPCISNISLTTFSLSCRTSVNTSQNIRYHLQPYNNKRHLSETLDNLYPYYIDSIRNLSGDTDGTSLLSPSLWSVLRVRLQVFTLPPPGPVPFSSQLPFFVNLIST